MVWEAEHQFNLEREGQTHIFPTRVSGCVDVRNHQVNMDVREGG